MDLFLYTLNCGKKTPNGITLVDELNSKLPNRCPGLLVFAFQELSSILDGTYYNKIEHILENVSIDLRTGLQKKYKETVKFVSMCHYGNIGLIVLSSSTIDVDQIVKSRGVPLGLYCTTLKGGIGVRIEINGQLYTFCVVHLNAGEGKSSLRRRNGDIRAVLSGIKFDDDMSVLCNDSHCFILGDFNYRVDNGRDQFTEVLEDGALVDFNEFEINFEPSYKFQIGTNEYTESRTPSWCDRIIYLGSPKYRLQTYDIVKKTVFSDHKPVVLHVELSNEKYLKDVKQSPFFGYDPTYDGYSEFVKFFDLLLWLGLYSMTPIGSTVMSITMLCLLSLGFYVLYYCFSL